MCGLDCLVQRSHLAIKLPLVYGLQDFSDTRTRFESKREEVAAKQQRRGRLVFDA